MEDDGEGFSQGERRFTGFTRISWPAPQLTVAHYAARLMLLFTTKGKLVATGTRLICNCILFDLDRRFVSHLPSFFFPFSSHMLSVGSSWDCYETEVVLLLGKHFSCAWHSNGENILVCISLSLGSALTHYNKRWHLNSSPFTLLNSSSFKNVEYWLSEI